MNQLLTPDEVSKILNCRPATIYAWAKTGRLPAYKLGGLLRFDLKEIEEWIESQRINIEPYPSRSLKKQGKGDIDKIIKSVIDSVKGTSYNTHHKRETRPIQSRERGAK